MIRCCLFLTLVFLTSCKVHEKQTKALVLDQPISKPQTPIMGWSSWNNFHVAINEVVIKSQADFMVSSGMAAAGYSYVNIDDGFFGGRDKNGDLLVHKERFPNGMKVISDYIHSKG